MSFKRRSTSRKRESESERDSYAQQFEGRPEDLAGILAMKRLGLRGISSLTFIRRAKGDTAWSNGARKLQTSWPALLTRCPREKGSDTPTGSLDFRGVCRLGSLLDPQKHSGIAGQLELALLGGQDNDAEGLCFPGMRDTNI